MKANPPLNWPAATLWSFVVVASRASSTRQTEITNFYLRRIPRVEKDTLKSSERDFSGAHGYWRCYNNQLLNPCLLPHKKSPEKKVFSIQIQSKIRHKIHQSRYRSILRLSYNLNDIIASAFLESFVICHTQKITYTDHRESKQQETCTWYQGNPPSDHGHIAKLEESLGLNTTI